MEIADDIDYHGNAVMQKKSIRLPISPGITMAML
jgi:hypothetical protein